MTAKECFAGYIWNAPHQFSKLKDFDYLNQNSNFNKRCVYLIYSIYSEGNLDGYYIYKLWLFLSFIMHTQVSRILWNHLLGLKALKAYLLQVIKGLVSDSNNIFLWHESEDIYKKGLFPKFQSIPSLRLQVKHDYVHWYSSILLCWINSRHE